jgi:hypothetical protein
MMPRWIAILIACTLLSLIPEGAAGKEGEGVWRIVYLSGSIVDIVSADSLCVDTLFANQEEALVSIPLDSIGKLMRLPSPGLSNRSWLIGLGGAALGTTIFLVSDAGKKGNSGTEDPIWGEAIYGLKLGGAMLLGAAAGLGIGSLVDQSDASEDVFDFSGNSRMEKHRRIRELLIHEGENQGNASNSFWRYGDGG